MLFRLPGRERKEIEVPTRSCSLRLLRVKYSS